MDESNNLKLLLDFSAVGTATLTNRINDLHCNAHIYYHQWKELNLHQNEVVKLLKLLRYYEGNLQFNGRGIWLMKMLIEFSAPTIMKPIVDELKLIEFFLRVGMEHKIHTQCFYILSLIQLKLNISYEYMFYCGACIADELPMTIHGDNFSDLMKFFRCGLSEGYNTIRNALHFICRVIDRVELHHNTDYFMDDLSQRYLDLIIQYNGKTLGDSNGDEESDDVIRLLFDSLKGLCRLNPLHCNIICRNGLVDVAMEMLWDVRTKTYSLSSHVIHSLDVSSAPALSIAILNFLSVISQHPYVRYHMASIISPSLLSSKAYDVHNLFYLQAITHCYGIVYLQTKLHHYFKLYPTLHDQYQQSQRKDYANPGSSPQNTQMSPNQRFSPDHNSSWKLSSSSPAISSTKSSTDNLITFVQLAIEQCVDKLQVLYERMSDDSNENSSSKKCFNSGRLDGLISQKLNDVNGDNDMISSVDKFLEDNISDNPVKDTLDDPSTRYKELQAIHDVLIIIGRNHKLSHHTLESVMKKGRSYLLPVFMDIDGSLYPHVVFQEYSYDAKGFNLSLSSPVRISQASYASHEDKKSFLDSITEAQEHEECSEKLLLVDIFLFLCGIHMDNWFHMDNVIDLSYRVHDDVIPANVVFDQSSQFDNVVKILSSDNEPKSFMDEELCKPVGPSSEDLGRTPIQSLRSLSSDNLLRPTDNDVILNPFTNSHHHPCPNTYTNSDIAKLLGMKIYLKHEQNIRQLTHDWELKPMPELCDLILIVFIISLTLDMHIIEDCLDLPVFIEILYDLLSDERLSLQHYHGMHEKCSRLFCVIAMHYFNKAETSSEPMNMVGLSSDDLAKRNDQHDTDISVSRPATTSDVYQQIDSFMDEFTVKIYSNIIDTIHDIIIKKEGCLRDEDINTLYNYMHDLTVLNSISATCRKKCVTVYRKLYVTFIRRDPFNAIAPLLRLTLSMKNSIGKLDTDGQEALLSLVAFALSLRHCYCTDICSMACQVILMVGNESAGFVHKLFMRREIEDHLYHFLMQGGIGLKRFEYVEEDELVIKRSEYDTTYAASDSTSTSYAASPNLTSLNIQLSAIDINLNSPQQFQSPSPRSNHEGVSLIKQFSLKQSRSNLNPHFLLVLRTCIMLIRDINPRPWWLSTFWNFGWQSYAEGLIKRPLISPHVIQRLIKMITSYSTQPYQLLYIIHLIEYGCCLAYNCSDGNLITKTSRPASLRRHSSYNLSPHIIPRPGNSIKEDIKNNLISFILPLIPNAFYFIIHDGNNCGRGKNNNYQNFLLFCQNEKLKSQPKEILKPEIDKTKDDNFVTSSKTTKKTFYQMTKQFFSTSKSSESQVKSNARSESILNFLTTSKPTQRRNASEDISGKRMSNASKSKAIDNNVADPNTSSTSKSKFESVGRQVNIRQNYVHELLVEKTIDATYALFCLDEMFPMSTYLLHQQLFVNCPVISCVAYLMSVYCDNDIILRRGVGIFKCFAENGIELNTLSNQAPSALLKAIKRLPDNIEIRSAYAKIIKLLASTNEMTRDTLLRFAAEDGLITILNNAEIHAESTALACGAIRMLCLSSSENHLIPDLTNLCHAILTALEKFPDDQRVQIEGLKALFMLTQMNKCHENICCHHNIEQILTNSKHFLQKVLKKQNLVEEYSVEEIIAILNQLHDVNSKLSQLVGDKCNIS